MEEAIQKADTLIEALGWIRRFRDKITVIKLGGSVMEHENALRHVLLDIVFMETVGMRPVVVHGGGAAIAAPFLWTGLEYFRSEVYYLRFSWLNVGYAFSDSPQASLVFGLGVYGIGFALMAAAALVSALPGRIRRATGLLLLVLLGVLTNFPEQDRPENRQPSGSYVDQVHQTRSSERESAQISAVKNMSGLTSAATVQVETLPECAGVPLAGLQAEFPADFEIPSLLDALVRKHPQAQLLVMSEYTLNGPPTDRIRSWCRKNQRHLIIGGQDPAGGDRTRGA